MSEFSLQDPERVLAEVKRLQFLGEVTAARQMLEGLIESLPNGYDRFAKLHNFLLLASPDITLADMGAFYRRFSEFVRPLCRWPVAYPNQPDPQRRLKIGYVAGDFGNHVLMFLLRPFFQFHDPRRFEIHVYSNTQPEDEMTDWFKAHAHHWRPIYTLSDEDALALIQQDQIDILVDLAGFGERNRLNLFLSKPAPIQVAAALGTLTTTALPTMDYRLADPVLVPDVLLPLHAETVVYLSHHMHWDPLPGMMDLAVTPSPFQQNGLIRFGCTNRSYKLNATVVALWSRLLKAVPGSELHLKCPFFDKPEVRQHFSAAFAAHGISGERIIFAGATPIEEHFAFWQNIDIALDPFPYQGGVTTFESLFMGVPVIALDLPTGPRTASAILHSIGYAELAASSEEQYLSLATGLANNPDLLQELRQKLRQLTLNSPACNGLAYARELENAYRWMWQRWCAGKPSESGTAFWPEHIKYADEPEPPAGWIEQLMTAAQTAFGRQQFELAEDICGQCLQLRPGCPPALHLLGLIAYQFKHLEPAQELMKQALQNAPDEPEYHFNLAGLLAESGKHQEALSHYQAALKLAPHLKDIPGFESQLTRLQQAVAAPQTTRN